MSAADNETDQTSPMDNTSDSGVRRVLSPGSMLRQKRESLQLDLNTAARDMNLDEWMLEALESDNFAKFSAQVFAKGHLKHYAQYLALNPDDLLFAYYQVAERTDTQPVINYPLLMTTEVNQHTLGSKWFMLLLGFLAFSALFYAVYVGGMWWLQDVQDGAQHSSTRQNVQQDVQQDLRQNMQESSRFSVESAFNETNDTASDEDVVTPAELNQVVSTQAPTQVSTTPTLTASAATPGPKASASPLLSTNSPLSADANAEILRFTFVESSWIEVLGDNEQQLIYGMADQGMVRELALSGPVKVFLGNVAGARITLNGESYTVPPGSKAGRTARFVLMPSE